MNLPTFKRSLPVLALLFIAAALVILPRWNAEFFANARYTQCGVLLKSDPGQALNLASTWRASRPESPLAKHCEALALYAVKDYGHAAEALGKLAGEVSATNPTLAAQLLLQATRAHQAAGHLGLAQETATSALMLQPENAEAKTLASEIAKNITEKPPVSPAMDILEKKLK